MSLLKVKSTVNIACRQQEQACTRRWNRDMEQETSENQVCILHINWSCN